MGLESCLERVGKGLHRPTKAEDFHLLRRDRHRDRLMDLIGAVIHGVAKGFLHCPVRPVIDTDRLCLIGYFGNVFRDHIVLDIGQGIPQLAVQRAGKDPLLHTDPRRVRLVHHFDPAVGEVIVRALIEKHETDVDRFPVFRRAAHKLHIRCHIFHVADERAFIQFAFP